MRYIEKVMPELLRGDTFSAVFRIDTGDLISINNPSDGYKYVAVYQPWIFWTNHVYDDGFRLSHHVWSDEHFNCIVTHDEGKEGLIKLKQYTGNQNCLIRNEIDKAALVEKIYCWVRI